MTDSFVTQCPHCQTSFRVSHAQLSVARGVVRCGSCLQVFNAARQLLEQRAARESGTIPPAAPAATAAVAPPAPLLPAAPPAPPPRAISQKQWTTQELDLDNLDLDEELARLEQREIQPAKAFGEHSGKGESFSARRDSDDDEAQWSGSLFSEPASEHDDIADDEPPTPIAPSRSERKPEQSRSEPSRSEPAKSSRTEPSLSFDLADLDDEPQAPRLKIEDDELEDAAIHEPLDADEHDEDEPAAGNPKKTTRTRSEPGMHDDVLLDLEDDPIHLDWQRRRSPWGRRLLWLLLVLLAAAALAGQYIAYHFDELARQDQYRPWFQQLCPEIGCKVPSKVDIARIKSSNLVVRSHPDFNGALVVDAIIYNRASFSQPFPLLELRFADLNGHLIASRRFKPGEYLGGDLSGQSEMPPQTPIHIALDILDPGAKAVNYSLSFHSPE
ncbi:DUF3426 domain-containing protein [Pseudomonas gingeri]|uniref:DUF3426 domain-containing protein n=1 Tax=Pseudomonas gingeri TaxID=117681 RepID=A0A7Y8CIK2_9PSED|nr:DUF3426 domain-containing protein [Pseudomonas gingeri]NWA00568.1 DUF3426 domain-containing protein [Pseudomonas gingeri]NWA14717.1 DUF3426 domain-containing protein [Pseudomonas gingeri]NWA56106.1 DUF3426 domain-containing protein [Pseudomonas gingeri]NWA96701.1 DUF3426 domain-containing protein [Pseudomonas gingeri]NWB03579.1 DUF3426 domain-containing protein [Pseudomonas gingeri]